MINQAFFKHKCIYMTADGYVYLVSTKLLSACYIQEQMCYESSNTFAKTDLHSPLYNIFEISGIFEKTEYEDLKGYDAQQEKGSRLYHHNPLATTLWWVIQKHVLPFYHAEGQVLEP